MSILIHISYNLIIKGYKTKATQTKINKINLIFVNSLSFHLQTFASLVSVFKFRSPHLFLKSFEIVINVGVFTLYTIM